MNEKENHLPNLSDKERAHALELAMKARKRRAVLKARMKSGELAFTDALNEEDAKRIEVVSLLKCVPALVRPKGNLPHLRGTRTRRNEQKDGQAFLASRQV